MNCTLTLVMDRLKYLSNLRSLLWDHLEDHCKPLTKAFIHCQRAHEDMPHALIFGKCPLVSKIIAKKHVFQLFPDHKYDRNSTPSTVTQEFEMNNGNKAEITYSTFPHFIEVDVETMTQTNAEKMALPELLKFICGQKNISGTRHVFILYNIDAMSSNIMHAMRKVLEAFSKNAYLVMTSKNQSTIIDAIKSRCVSVNAWINIKKIGTMLVDDVRPELIPYIDGVLQKAQGDLVNFVTLLEVPVPDAYIGYLTHFVESRLIDMCQAKDFFEMETKIREMCTKLTAACVCIPHVIKKIIDFTNIHTPNCVYDVVAITTDVQHKISVSNKALFALEYMLHQIIMVLKPHLKANR